MPKPQLDRETPLLAWRCASISVITQTSSRACEGRPRKLTLLDEALNVLDAGLQLGGPRGAVPLHEQHLLPLLVLLFGEVPPAALLQCPQLLLHILHCLPRQPCMIQTLTAPLTVRRHGSCAPRASLHVCRGDMQCLCPVRTGLGPASF